MYTIILQDDVKTGHRGSRLSPEFSALHCMIEVFKIFMGNL